MGPIMTPQKIEKPFYLVLCCKVVFDNVICNLYLLFSLHVFHSLASSLSLFVLSFMSLGNIFKNKNIRRFWEILF